MGNQDLKIEKKEGDSGYVNKNCWLAGNLGYPPSKRCQYCESKFNDCLFERYLVVSSILAFSLLFVSYLVEKNISKLLIVSIFVLIITYGYFFNKSTEKIVISNFEEKKAKNSFKELSGTLQQKVDEQTKDIKEQKEKVEKAYEVEKEAHEELKKLDQNKTEFMLITQHHLRTPLSGNMGFLDLLMSGQFGKIPVKIKKVISSVRDSTQKEINVVNELLDVSSYQLGKDMILLHSGTDIEDLMEETLKDLKLQAKNKGIYLKYTKEGVIPKIPSDRTKLKLALTNIIDNCIKYTLEGGVTVSLKTENNKLLILVKDTGVGISKEAIPNLFNQTFHRGEQAQKMFAVGKGIGLFLSGKIIDGHHGKIWVESEGEGNGSTFHIELPIALPVI